ncbi:BZ3500_MvSof-1268-A1-R1_Chr2-1g04505 [Microbotryum saponariae]|uniref:BZ3500_MvSof-1268-A1-R1_Chr2-1g04505 protein n=1 Tax=Microbotryum saponariae TaxID=289078 RepID=A0A2X0KFG9_9BASI|nr:BZ3500_MvSof-1268-A1-R1_Chr2-1g04505 [Microbotryum saponariae]SCZ91869.1 BZ3501_MvSof-1269-A2-R1_Chr2-1g04161 [Microbotryum saponariae]
MRPTSSFYRMDSIMDYTSPSNSSDSLSPLSAPDHISPRARRGSNSIDATAPEGKRLRSVGPTDSGYFSDASSASQQSSTTLDRWVLTAASGLSSFSRGSASECSDDSAIDLPEEEGAPAPRPRLQAAASMPTPPTRRSSSPPRPGSFDPDNEPPSPRPATLSSRFDARPGAARAFTAPSGDGLAESVSKALSSLQVIPAQAEAHDSQIDAAFLHDAAQRAQPSDEAASSASAPSASLNKDRFVAGLVGASVLAIESIWGASHSTTEATVTDGNVLPLHWFVKEVLRRSRTSCSTLQLALYYLHKSRRTIRETVARAEDSRPEYVRLEVRLRRGADAVADAAYPSPPLLPTDRHVVPDETRFAQLAESQQSPVLCGRRMFLAALIAASKYLQDRNYSNRAWARISGLPVLEVNANERAFLVMIGFSLHLDATDFCRWTQRLSALTSQGAALESAAASSASLVRLRPTLSVAEIPIAEPARQPCPVVGDSSKQALDRLRSARLSTGPMALRQQLSPEDSDDGGSYATSSGDDEAPSHCSASSHSVKSSFAGRKVRAMPTRRAAIPLTRSNVRRTASARNPAAVTLAVDSTSEVEAVTQGAAVLSWCQSNCASTTGSAVAVA